MPATSLRESLRAMAKESVWLTVRYRQGDRPAIGLFCSRRGGSTWLMEIIGANRGVLPLNQPVEAFTPNLTPYQYARLPAFDRGVIVHPDAEEEAELRAYTDELMAGRMRVNAPHRFWRRDFSFRTDRLLLKIIDAKAMMDWFDTHYDMDIVYLVRHPVPQALSCIRNGWGTSTKAYLRNEWFVEEVIADPAALDMARRLADEGSELERMVLNWTVENLYPLKVLADRPHWLALSYEETVLDPEGTFAQVSERLSLTDTDRMRRAAARASASSGLSQRETLTAIAARDEDQMVGRWRDQISESDRTDVARILATFGVTLYSADSATPSWAGYR
jgi:hypothetical protein